MINFSISNCDLAEIIAELIRFLSHITLLHLINFAIDSKEKLFETNYLKVMLFTALAIIMYHLFLKKFFDFKINKMKKICPKVENFSDDKKLKSNNKKE